MAASSPSTVTLEDIVWDPSVYPRQKTDSGTIDRYADALRAGATFPPIILEAESSRLLDGKHRVEAYRKVESEDGGKPSDVRAEWHVVPEGMSARYYAATLSAGHGIRISNAELKAIAEEEFEADRQLDPTAWGKGLGVSKSTVYRWVSHILERERTSRSAHAWRLSQLGWTQREIGERLGVTHQQVSADLAENSQLGKTGQDLGADWNDKGLAEYATRCDLPLTDSYAAAMGELDDAERLARLDIKLQPYDVWQFSSCHDLMGASHPGRIPGQLILHALYFFTQPGDLVVDPMVGSGTTLDACLLMGRKARGYDLDKRHERVDIEQHEGLPEAWPDSVSKAKLIFWDPPYFDKMDADSIGEGGYVEGSISGLDPNEYLGWMGKAFTSLHASVNDGTCLAFLMSDWDPENAKDHGDTEGIFLWDYADLLRDAGWTLQRQIQCPLSTQQVHPDTVLKFRKSRRLARLERYLLVAVK